MFFYKVNPNIDFVHMVSAGIQVYTMPCQLNIFASSPVIQIGIYKLRCPYSLRAFAPRSDTVRFMLGQAKRKQYDYANQVA